MSSKTKTPLKSNEAFLKALQEVAKEQHALVGHRLLPGWMDPFSRVVATHALVFVSASSFFVSMVLFLVKFNWFLMLAERISPWR